MRWAVLGAATLVACGGQILDVTNDEAGSDGATTKDASVVDVVVFDVKQQDSPPPPPPGCVSTSGLLAYFPLDNDTLDHSGNGNHATGKNLVQSQGVLGNGMAFDGSSSILEVTSGAAVLKGPRTLCAWMQVKPTPGLGSPLFTAGLSTNTDFYSLTSMSSSGACPAPPLTPFIEHTGSTCVFQAGPPIIQQGPWQFVCYAFDGGKVTFVTDNFFAPPAPAVLYDYPLTTLFIGSNLGTSKTTGSTFTGILDEVSVWSVFLSPTDTQALWNNGKGCPL